MIGGLGLPGSQSCGSTSFFGVSFLGSSRGMTTLKSPKTHSTQSGNDYFGLAKRSRKI